MKIKKRNLKYRERGYSHLGGGALNIIGNLASKVVSNTMKSDIMKNVGNGLIGDIKKQAVSMAHSHVDNIANAVREKTGLKIDTRDIKKVISDKANSLNTNQLGGGYNYAQYGSGFPLALVGNIAGKLVSSAAKSGVADKLVKIAQDNAKTIGNSLINEAKNQVVSMAKDHVDKLATELKDKTGIRVDTTDLKNNIDQKSKTLF